MNIFFQKACLAYNNIVTDKNISLGAKGLATTTIVAAYALIAFASFALISSAAPSLSILGIVIFAMNISSLLKLPDLIKRHKMLEHTDNNNKNINDFISEAMKDLVTGVTIFLKHR